MTTAVADTSTAISGLLWSGPPGEILKGAVDGRWIIYASDEIVAELKEVLIRPKFQPRLARLSTTAESVLSDLIPYLHLTVVSGPPSIQSRDAKDDIFLACAEAAGVDYLISGDSDLLAIGQIGKTRIVTARDFLDNLT